MTSPLVIQPGSPGFYLYATGTEGEKLYDQPEPKWSSDQAQAEANALAIAERTGIAVLVVQVVSKVVPWHQGR